MENNPVKLLQTSETTPGEVQICQCVCSAALEHMAGTVSRPASLGRTHPSKTRDQTQRGEVGFVGVLWKPKPRAAAEAVRTLRCGTGLGAALACFSSLAPSSLRRAVCDSQLTIRAPL